MFVDRSRSRGLRHLEWRVRVFGAGAILGLMGIWFEVRWLVWAALAVLLLGVVLRFLPWGGEDAHQEGGEEPGREAPGPTP